MSGRVVGLVFACEGLAPLRKLVLAAFANHAHDDGAGSFPSVRLVSAETGLDRRTVQRHVRALQDSGHLVRLERARQHRPAVFRLDFDTLRGGTSAAPDTGSGAAPVPPLAENRGGAGALRGGAGASQGRRWCRPNLQEPSKNRRARETAPPDGSAGDGQPSGGAPIIDAEPATGKPIAERVSADLPGERLRQAFAGARQHARDCRVIEATAERVVVSAPTAFMAEIASNDYRDRIAEAFGVDPGAVEIVAGGGAKADE